MSAKSTWRELERDARARLADAGIDDAAGDARRIVEEVSGYDGADAVLHHDDRANTLQRRTFADRVERRCTGEPLQYVLGRWGFRTLDLLVDRRVLIPRPETEVVAGHAIEAVRALERDAVVVDLGTGLGRDRPRDRGRVLAATSRCGRPTSRPTRSRSRGRTSPGSGVVPRQSVSPRATGTARCQRSCRVASTSSCRTRPTSPTTTSCPRRCATGNRVAALVAGRSGLEAIERILADAPRWLAPGGALVVEVGETQGAAAAALATAAGLTDPRSVPTSPAATVSSRAHA